LPNVTVKSFSVGFISLPLYSYVRFAVMTAPRSATGAGSTVTLAARLHADAVS